MTKRPTRWGEMALYLVARLEAKEGQNLESKFMRAWAMEMLSEVYKCRQVGRHFYHLLDGGWVVPCGTKFRFSAGGIRVIKAVRAARRAAQAAPSSPAEASMAALPGSGCQKN